MGGGIGPVKPGNQVYYISVAAVGAKSGSPIGLKDEREPRHYRAPSSLLRESFFCARDVPPQIARTQERS